MPYKVLVGECKQEVSSFNPVISHYEDFDVSVGPDLLAYHHGLKSEMAGAMSIFQAESDLEIFPTYSVRAITSGGTLSQAGFERIGREFLEAVRQAPPVDAIYLSLHGAMAAETEDDPEGWLITEIRKVVGDQIPLVISMDLHGILTERMLGLCDAVVAYHTYPHNDFYETGVRAAKVLMRILKENLKPVTIKVDVPALVRGPELLTKTGLYGRSIRQAQAVEAGQDGLSAGFFIGNPFTDVPELASRSFIVTTGDPEKAKVEAIQMAEGFWEVRSQLLQPLISLDETVTRTAALVGQGTVMLVDAADATSSGASGDSNAILRGLIEADYPGRVLTTVVDPPAVEAAMAAGIGQRIQTTLGGQLDRKRFEPFPVEAEIRLLSDGHFVSESHGSPWYAGPTAVLQVGQHIVVATSRAVSLYDRSLFYAAGQDPKNFDAVVVKSPHCQLRFFDDWCVARFDVDVPGSTSANLPSLGHVKCQRPIFPLDENVVFKPEAKVFQRG